MGAELRLSSQYPGEGGEPAPHGSVCDLVGCLPYEAAGLDAFLGDWAAFTGKRLPGPVRMVDK